MKKKLSMLAAMALCVTVGGVYATWIYATDAVPTAYATMGVTMTGTATGGQAGTLTIAGTNVDLTIDDDATDEHVHKATLVSNPAGFFTITFTPNTNAESDIQDGVNLQWSVGIYNTGTTQAVTPVDNKATWDYTYSSTTTNIFTVDTTSETILATDMDGEIGGPFTYELKIEDVLGKITLNNNMYLTTIEQYNAASAAVAKMLFHVHVQVAPSQVTNA